MVRFGSISGSFGLAMGILARLHLAKIRTIARPNSPDMPLKRTKKVRLGVPFMFDMLMRVYHSVSRLLEISRARVYFVRPAIAIAIAKIRDYSQSNKIVPLSLKYFPYFSRLTAVNVVFVLRADDRIYIFFC